MTEDEAYELVDRMAREAAEGCCMDDRWRGHACQYHEGYEDGLYAMLTHLGTVGES